MSSNPQPAQQTSPDEGVRRAVPADSPEVHHLGKKAVLPDLLPARMLNEYVYCPRLFYYEWVEGVFEQSVDTLDGQAKHSRVDTEPGAMPKPEEMDKDGERIHSRSVTLSSARLGLIAKMDLIESDGNAEPAAVAAGAERNLAKGPSAADATSLDAASQPGASPDEGVRRSGMPAEESEVSSQQPGASSLRFVRPVDYKRGKPRDVDGVLTPWPSDRIQIGAQALVLRDNGYRCDEGMLYYATTKQRVRIAIDDALITETEQMLAQARAAAASERIPEPLVDSPKCPRCSLVGICLPDETNALRARALRFDDGRAVQIQLFPDGVEADAATKVRQMVAPREELRPLYLNSQGFRVGKSGEVIQVKD